MGAVQNLLLLLIVAWAAWYTFGHLLPRRQRLVRGWLARQADGHLPARLVGWIRPGFPVTGCGCGSARGGDAAPRCASVQPGTPGAPPPA